MSEPRLSVLLPCRDAAEHLPQAVRSLKLQTFRDFEVVAVNDGSRDETGDILERWAAKDDCVRVAHLEQIGLARALQAGADMCRGEYLARADADDVAHPRRFAEQVEYLSARGDVAAAGTHVRYFPHEEVGWGARRYQGWLNRLADPEELARDVFVECPIAHPTLMIRRSLFAEVGGYRANGWPEDYDLILRLHVAGARLANVPRVLHFWREGNHRASRNDPRYLPGAFRSCKIHYLRRSCLEGRDAVNIWGAGRVGKDFARALIDEGVTVRGFFDIDPRKIGQEIYGAPVRDARDVTHHRDTYLLVAVGAAGARELIRLQLDQAGFEEPQDYRCAA
ncbi:MAG: glycosyltransferase [Gemmatimonadota bacterium]|nr:MAG: glycosyltransferase [Gemmatimonadota bacterium]